MTKSLSKCNCKKMSCIKDCSKNHTHKGFFCQICEPEAVRQMNEPNPTPLESKDCQWENCSGGRYCEKHSLEVNPTPKCEVAECGRSLKPYGKDFICPLGHVTPCNPTPSDWEVKLAEEGTPLAVFQKERTDAISEMFDNKYDNGIYPTSKFFARLDNCVIKLLSQLREEASMETARKIALSANSAGLAPKELTSDEDWKAEVKKIKEEARRETLEEVKNSYETLKVFIDSDSLTSNKEMIMLVWKEFIKPALIKSIEQSK